MACHFEAIFRGWDGKFFLSKRRTTEGSRTTQVLEKRVLEREYCIEDQIRTLRERNEFIGIN
jgi:hypothetical protein